MNQTRLLLGPALGPRLCALDWLAANATGCHRLLAALSVCLLSPPPPDPLPGSAGGAWHAALKWNANGSIRIFNFFYLPFVFECVSLLALLLLFLLFLFCCSCCFVAFCSVCLLAENYLFYFWFRCPPCCVLCQQLSAVSCQRPTGQRQLKAKLMLN